MRGSFNQPDVAPVTFEEVQFTDQIQPVIYLLCVEPMTTSVLHKQQLRHLQVKF